MLNHLVRFEIANAKMGQAAKIPKAPITLCLQCSRSPVGASLLTKMEPGKGFGNRWYLCEARLTVTELTSIAHYCLFSFRLA